MSTESQRLGEFVLCARHWANTGDTAVVQAALELMSNGKAPLSIRVCVWGRGVGWWWWFSQRMGSFLFSQEMGPKPRAGGSPESAAEWKSASLDFIGGKSGCLGSGW